MKKQDFLVEIGTEELPPKSLARLGQAFRDELASGLATERLGWENIHWYAAPRRLAILVSGLQQQAPDRQLEVMGPPESVAFDSDGKPTRAALAFAQKNGLDVNALTLAPSDKGRRLVHRCLEPGAQAAAVLPDLVRRALEQLPIPKRMRWGALREEFVRPVHWVVMLLGDETLQTELLGVRSGRHSRGHRFHHPQDISIDHPSRYRELLLEQGRVIADFAERRENIRRQVEQQAQGLKARAVIDDDLLDEVTGLVEWPIAHCGRFEERFLAVPQEALVSAMQEHQKYFPVVDDRGRLLPYFIFVANLGSRDPQQIIEGNERVIRPRLADAAFFYETDRKTSLQSRRERLKTIVYQEQLGTLWDKTVRVAKLAQFVAHQTGADGKLAARAAELSKADLASELVLEFSDLQGIAGGYYADHDGEPAAVGLAIREQYLPRYAGDELPSSPVGCTLALADRLDSLVGIFGINQFPSGSKDPFALRRMVIGVIRIIRDRQLAGLDLKDLIWEAKVGFGDRLPNAQVERDVSDFFFDRYRAMYLDEGVPANTVIAVQHAVQNNDRIPHNPYDIALRIQAVEHFRQLDEAEALAAANKRVQNILAKQGEDIEAAAVKPGLFTSEFERALHTQLVQKAASVPAMCESRQYTQALSTLAELKQPVDAFFDHVMVMDPDPQLRANRVNLLRELNHLFLLIADVAQLQEKAKP